MLRGFRARVAIFCLSICPATTFAQSDSALYLSEGELRLAVSQVLAAGFDAASDGESLTYSVDGEPVTSLLADPSSDFVVRFVDGAPRFEGTIVVNGTLQIDRESARRTIRHLAIRIDDSDGAVRLLAYDLVDPDEIALILTAGEVGVDPIGQTVLLAATDITLSPSWARSLGVDSERLFGSVLLRARMDRIGGASATPLSIDQATEDSGAVAGEVPNPDIIVGHVSNVGVYGLTGEIGGYSIGAISCNIGTDVANWIAGNPNHPVISQTLFRLKDNRFEQLGISWVKHGFAALNGTLCCPPGVDCCQDTPNSTLGVGCSDPYDAGLNGSWSYLGPRYQIDANTGAFPADWKSQYPEFPDPPEVIARRLQIHQDDVNPANNAGAEYFGEVQYVARDEATAGNQDNSVSYRRAIVPGNLILGAYVITFPGSEPTVRMKPAIKVWKLRDPSVEEIEVRVPGEGLFHLSAKVTDLGNGVWEYEYALYNQNSHRSAASFRVPIRPDAVIQNIGFHDVSYHSGEPFDGTDWTPTIDADAITWATTPYATNENANALRWGTLFNFRFQANVAPQESTIDIGLFRPGSPDTVVARIVGPSLDLIDCNDNGVDDICDLDCFALGCAPPCGGGVDCNSNGVPDECEPDCNGNQQADGCDISLGFSKDCNANTVPDECEADCDDDGVPDTCDPDTTADCDGDGVFGCEDICPCSSPANACVCPPECLCCLFDNCFMYPCGAPCTEIGGISDCTETSCRAGCTLEESNGDFDWDGDVDLSDMRQLLNCFSDQKEKPDFSEPSETCLARFDLDADDDVDLADLDLLIENLSGPMEEP